MIFHFDNDQTVTMFDTVSEEVLFTSFTAILLNIEKILSLEYGNAGVEKNHRAVHDT